MSNEEKEIALYCLKATSGYHSEVCEECVRYPNCDHTMQDDVIESIIKTLEQEPKTGKWIRQTDDYHDYYECEQCGIAVGLDDIKNYCPNCGCQMRGDSNGNE